MSEVERWISLEDIAAHLDVSKDTIRGVDKKRERFRITKLADSINFGYLKWMPGSRAAKALTQINKPRRNKRWQSITKRTGTG